MPLSCLHWVAVFFPLPRKSYALGSYFFPVLNCLINNWAFACNQLTLVKIESSIQTIGDSVFYNNKLISVTIGRSIQTIGNRVFYNNQLTSVTIGNGIQTIGNSTFQSN